MRDGNVSDVRLLPFVRRNSTHRKARQVVDSVNALLKELGSASDSPFKEVTSFLLGACDRSHRIIREHEDNQ